MACGTPVLCSDIPVHRELYDGAASFFPPDSPDLLAEAICAVKDGASASAEAAKATVAHFSWEAMAQRMATYFEELTRDKPRAARLS
jgi:glycosyltransferase involved in cell wall biosynthesis